MHGHVTICARTISEHNASSPASVEESFYCNKTSSDQPIFFLLMFQSKALKIFKFSC